MITPNNMKQASGIAEVALFQDKALTPVNGSPLYDLVESVNGIDDQGSDHEIISLSQRMNTATGSHGEIQKKVIQGAVRVLTNTIKVARGEINPKIKEVLADIEVARQQAADRASKLDKTIIQIELAPVLTDDMFLELIRPYEGGTPTMNGDESMMVRNLLNDVSNDLTEEEITILSKTGSSLLDDRIQSFASSKIKDSECLLEGINIKRPLPCLVATFMILTGIMNDRLEKASAIVEGDFNQTLIAKARQIVGNEIAKKIERLTTAIKNNSLIASPLIDGSNDEMAPYQRQNAIHVIGPVYREWLQNLGGSPEAVLGYGATTQTFNPSLANRLHSDPQHFVGLYERELTHGKSVAVAEDVKIVRKTIISSISKQIRDGEELTEAEQAELQLRLKQCLEVPYFGNTELIGYVRNVVCKVFTDGDDVKRVLIEIDSALEQMDEDMGEEKAMKQAVYIAICRLVASWVTSQIQVNEG